MYLQLKNYMTLISDIIFTFSGADLFIIIIIIFFCHN